MMQADYLIEVKEFCSSNDVDIAFISSLEQNGLIEITTISEEKYIDAGQLQQLEKYVRFYYELDINLEGIETITHLLQRINNMQDEIRLLKNRLRLYEPES
jgi:chaperone modulatory protein CbpM